MKLLELEIPDIAFPFDVTGGADRFKSKRCALRHLVFDLSADGLAEAVRNSPLVDFGFIELKSAIRDGFVEFAGRFAVGDHQADFTFRASLLLQSRGEASVVFYDTRVYGWLPVPAALLPAYLRRALTVPFETYERGGIWRLKPLEQFLRFAMPRNGWKIPDHTYAGLVAAQCARGRIIIVAGPEGEPDRKQQKEREPDANAVLAAEGVANNLAAEEALAAGKIHEAYDHFRHAIYDDRGGPWARERLLQIGAADPELTLETRHLAEEVLGRDQKNVQALLAVAAIAMREGSFGDAAARYGALAEIARNQRLRFDAIAAELAVAAASTPIDPGGALAAYERAAARARDSVVAHQALLELRSSQGDWVGAVQAGERLVKLEPDPQKKSFIHRRLGAICRSQVVDLKRARMHFERALRITPDDPEALEGLAETYAARGEPARAASYIARLAEQAEQSGDRKRIAALNLRLGEIWERWLGDPETAATRYFRVLDADPKHRTAQLRLAELAEARGDLAEARGYYEDVLAVEEESGGDAEAIPDLVAAYTRLARVTLSAEGLSAEAVACLERAVELDPQNRSARDELARLLRERGDWGRLITLLDEWTAAATDPDEIRRANLHAARVQLEQRHDKEAARKHLEEVLNVAPHQAEALELILPILAEDRDTVALTQRLAAAADATTEPIRRADFLFQLAGARAALRLALDVRLKPLEQALDANPYHLDAAREMVNLLRQGTDLQRLADGLERAAVAATNREHRVEALLERSDLLANKLDNIAGAEQVLREALGLAPEHTQGWIELADMQRQQGNNAGSRETLVGTLDDDRLPAASRPVIHRRLAELARTDGDSEEEVTHLKATLRAGTTDEELSARLHEVLKGLGRQAELADLLEDRATDAEGAEADKLWLEAAQLRGALEELDRAQQIYLNLTERGGSTAMSAALELEKLALGHDDFDTVARALEVQLKNSEADKRPPVFERLIDAQVLRDDEVAAEEVCVRLLELDTGNAKARRFLAERAGQDHHFDVVLEHWTALLLKGDPEREGATHRQETYRQAAALAREIQAGAVDDLQIRFDEEFPDADDDALAAPLGTLLATQGEWEELLGLRHFQLKREPENLLHHREIADILHTKLDRDEEAAGFYEQVMRAEPDNLAVQLPLNTIYERLERFSDLGQLLFVMSGQAEEAEDALEYGLKSASIFAHQVEAGTELAQRSLRALAQRTDVDPDEPRLLETLLADQMYLEVASLIERSLREKPDVEDGRFNRLLALYGGPLADAGAAAQWCATMAEQFPDSDVPWRMWVDILGQHREAGDVVAVLQSWADARAGEARADILVELVEHTRGTGDEDRALTALADAAEAFPESKDVLTQLVTAFTEQKVWDRALFWLQKLAGLYAAGDTQDEYLRQMVTIATGDGNDEKMAARALEQLSNPIPEETAQLGHLYIAQQDFERLAQREAVAELLDGETLVVAAEGLASCGHFTEARSYFERAFDDPGLQPAIWEKAAAAWQAGDRKAELGRWRIAWSQTDKAVNPVWLRLRGYLELAAAGEDKDPKAHSVALSADFATADLGELSHALLVFEAAKIAKGFVDGEWLQRGAKALEKLLPEDAVELPEVLYLRFAYELAEGRAELAVEIAQRMLAREDQGAAECLEQAFEAAGRIDDLLSHLVARAEKGGAQAPQLWMRVAEIYAEREAWQDTVQALSAVSEDERPLRWGELRFDCGVALDDSTLRVQGAERRAELLTDDHDRAEWLRIAGRLRWWQLDDEAAAGELLRRAQELVPIDVATVEAGVNKHLAAGEDVQARRQLEEGLAVLSGPETIGLWVELTDICIKYEERDAGLHAIEQALALGTNDSGLWARLGEQAHGMGRKDLVQEAYAQAYALEPNYEAPYVTALEVNEAWDQLITVLAERGEQLSGSEAANRFEHAAQAARDQLGDKKRAVQLLGLAVRAAPTVDNLLTTFGLALDLQKPKLVASVGPPLLKRLEDDALQRPEVLRQTVDALSAIEEHDATYELRQELVQRELATAVDKIALGQMERPKDPAAAAALFGEAAEQSDGAERAELQFAAAQCWQQAQQDDHARPLVKAAIAGGVDSAAAHALAFSLLSDDARLHSAARLVELGGDAEWEETRRAALRFELATARLQEGSPDAAQALLVEARDFGKPQGWALAMESALRALGRQTELADLWLDEAQTDDCPWSDIELLPRVREALEVYTAAGLAEGEQLALQFSAVLGPRLLATLTADAPERFEVLRHTVDALDRLDRSAETREPRQALVAGGAATAVDKLVLGRLQRQTDPTGAAALLAEAAQETTAGERPPLLFEAALAWHEAQNDEEARPLVHAAVSEGIDSADAHALAYALLDGPARIHSAGRLVDLGGDAEWDNERRATIRFELANARLDEELAELGHELLMAAREYGKPRDWAKAMERALRLLKQHGELAALWLEEGGGEDCPWTDIELLERANEALRIYDMFGHEDGQTQALNLLTVVGPRLLAQLGPENAIRTEVLRHTIDALDKLDRSDETRQWRNELVERGAATATDKLQLGRMARREDPAAAAALLAQAANETSVEERPPLLFEASLACHEAGKDDAAGPLVRAAINGGVDSVEAHSLAFELLAGDDRLLSAARLVELEGDADWEEGKRADLRFDLARARMAEGQPGAAYDLLTTTRDFGKPTGWAITMEVTLQQLQRNEELANLWLNEARAEDCPWADNDLLPRLREALEVFGLLGDEAAKSETFAFLAVLGPRLLEQTEAEDPLRLEVIRATVDALDGLERGSETKALRHELVAQQAANAADKLALGRMERDERPEVAGTLLAQAANEGPPDLRADLLFDAATAFHDADRDDQAAPLVREAIMGGVDSVAAHSLAFAILSDDDRLVSAARLVELEGDTDWEAGHRAAVRLELAQARLQQGLAEDAHELLAGARNFQKPDGWALAMEAALQSLMRRDELAELWLSEGQAQDCPWPDHELLPRLAEALSIYLEADNQERAHQTLEQVAVVGPRMLSALTADDQTRLTVLRWTTDALDRLERTDETGDLRHELMQLDAATAVDKLELGRLERRKNPAVAGALLAQAANEGPAEQRAELMLEAALALQEAGDDPNAGPLVREAIMGGVDTAAAHELAYLLLEGGERIQSAARLVELEGDAKWDNARRAVLRQDLAQARTDLGESEAAHALLVEARALGKPPGWALLMETVLSNLGRNEDLANLWMNEGQAEDTPWSGEDLDQRARQAAGFFSGTSDTGSELQALEFLTRLVPEDVEVRDRLAEVAAALGDSDRFLQQVAIQLERAGDADARSTLVLRYAPILETQFEEPEAAVKLLREVFTGGATIELAEALTKAMVGDAAEELVAMLSEGADQDGLVPAIAAGLLVRAARVVVDPIADQERAFDLYHAALLRDAADTEAQTFCFELAQAEQNWEQAISILELAATGDQERAHELLQKAADLARDKLEDKARELSIVKVASEMAPEDDEISARLLQLQLALKDLDGVTETLFAGKVPGKKQVNLAVKLASALRKAKRPDEAEEVMEWMIKKHPHSLAASDYRMQKARDQGDNATLLKELESRIDHPATFELTEKAIFHAEAGRAALSLGEREKALEHFVSVLEGGKLAADALFHAVTIAREIDDQEKLNRLWDHSAKIRDAIRVAVDDAPPVLQSEWLSLLGVAHERAGDVDQAVEAHAQVVAAAEDAPPIASVEFLRRGYETQEDWQGLVDLNTKVARFTEDPTEQAQLFYEVGVLWRDRLEDIAEAGNAFEACLAADPEHAAAQLALGLYLSRMGDHDKALPLLFNRLDIESPETPVDDLVTFAETLKKTETWERAVDVTSRVLARDPNRHTLHRDRAEMLEALERRDEAETEWRMYADALGPAGAPEELAPIRQRLAKSAVARDALDEAIVQLNEAMRLLPDSLEIIVQLRILYEKTHQWREVTELRLQEATGAESAEEQITQYRELARIHRHELGDFAGAGQMLERALAAAPDNVELLGELLITHEDAGDFTKFLVVAERILTVVPEKNLEADFFARLARAYEEAAGDKSLAKEFYGKAAQRDPENARLRDKHRQLARDCGDFAEFAAAEEEAIAALDDAEEQVARYRELAEVYLRQLSDLGNATTALANAAVLRPDDVGLLRQLADTYALDDGAYDRAATIYNRLLELNPLDVEVIRIRARLAGQMSDTDRAYGCYAALLTLIPSDEEAFEYVQACRGARPVGPQRAISDEDRARGLIHQAQSGPAEELFAPLARFAELTKPGDLAGRGISDGDKIAADDPRAAWLSHVLVPLGLPQVDLYIWRGGGFGCEAEFLGSPTLLLGSSLAESPNERERAFIVAREAELYRTGHALCGRLSEFELSGLLAAICLAVDPSLEPPNATFETVEWAQAIATPMTAEIRAQFVAQVQNYLAAAQAEPPLDMGAWRQGCISTATRLALLECCDIAEAIGMMMRTRGFEDITDEQRVAVIQESAEDLDLFRFALSDSYFVLRQNLGLALRPQG